MSDRLTDDLASLHGPALRQAFDEACITRGQDPGEVYDAALEGVFGLTEEELAREHGPDWYEVGDDACQGIHDLVLRQIIRALQTLDLSVKGDICGLAAHQVLAEREWKEQIRRLVEEQRRGSE